MANIEIQVTDDAIARALTQTQEALLDLREPFEDFGEYLLTETRDRFDQQRAPDGKQWLDISEEWRDRKRKEGRPTEIGVYTRQLRDFSLSYRAGFSVLTFGSSAEHAVDFNKDRPFLGLSEQDRREFVETLRESILPS